MPIETKGKPIIDSNDPWGVEYLEDFFSKTEIPKGPIKIFNGTMFEPKKFIEGHLRYCRANRFNNTFLPYYDRLVKFKEYLETKNTNK